MLAHAHRHRSTIGFVAGTLVYQAGRLLLSLVAARALGPAVFGDWVLISLLIVYLSAVGLGMTNGAAHQIPYRAGSGDLALARRVADVATGASLLSALVAAVLAAAICSLVLSDTSPPVVVLAAVAAALQHPFLLQQVLFRSWFAFGRAAGQLAAQGIVVLGLGIALIRFGLAGLLVAQIITFVTAIGGGVALLPHRPLPRFDAATARRLLGIGFPIMVAGLAYGLLTTMDRWLVAFFLTRVDVGYYGLVGIALSGLLLVPQLLSQQFYPRMSYAHGEGAAGPHLLAMAHRQGLVGGVVVAGLAVVTVLAAWIIVPVALGAYRPSLLPLTIASSGVVAYAFSAGYGNLLNTIGAHRRFLTIQLAAIGIDLALALAMLTAGFGLAAVALASAVGMAAYSILMFRAATAAVAPASPTPS